MTFEVRNGCFGYKKTVPILKNISFCVESRQVLAVLGPNGVGKTTLLRSMMGMLPWTSGGSFLEGENIRDMTPGRLWREMAYVQQAKSFPFAFTVEEMILLGRSSRIGTFGTPEKADRERCERAMEELGIAHMRRNHHTGYRRQADENGNNEKYHREHRTDRLNRRRIALHIGITAQRRAILYIPLCHVNVRNLLLFLRNRLIEVRKIFFIFCLAVRVFRLTFKQLFPSFGEIFLTVLYLRRSLLFLLRQLRLAFGKRHTAVLQLCSLIGNLRFSEDDLCFPFVQFVPCRIKLLPCRLFCRIQLRLCLAERLDCRPHISQSHCKLYQLIGCGLLQRLQKRTLAVRHQSRHRRLCLRGILLCDHRSCYG